MLEAARRTKASGASAVGVYRSEAVEQLGFWPVLEQIAKLIAECVAGVRFHRQSRKSPRIVRRRRQKEREDRSGDLPEEPHPRSSPFPALSQAP